MADSDKPMPIQPMKPDTATPMSPIGGGQHEGPLRPSRSKEMDDEAARLRKAALKKQRDQQTD